MKKLTPLVAAAILIVTSGIVGILTQGDVSAALTQSQAPLTEITVGEQTTRSNPNIRLALSSCYVSCHRRCGFSCDSSRCWWNGGISGASSAKVCARQCMYDRC